MGMDCFVGVPSRNDEEGSWEFVGVIGEDFFCNRGGRRKIEAIMTIKTGIKTRMGMPLSGLGSRGTGVGLGGNWGGRIGLGSIDKLNILQRSVKCKCWVGNRSGIINRSSLRA